jgi:hypothetical protein
MQRTNTQQVAALSTGLAIALTAGSTSAAIWTWACEGELSGQRIVFDRDGLYIASGGCHPRATRPGNPHAVE